MFSSESWLSNQQAGFYNGVATQSLRLDDGSSAFLSRTPSSAGNRKTWTWSGWLKRGNLGGGHGLIESTSISFGLALDKLFITVAGVGNGLTTAVFRDSSAWYHVLIAFDTTQASSVDRVKFYVNGTQHSLDNTRVSQNTDYNINNTTLQRIGVTSVLGSTTYIDGYLSEVNFIDGTALDPTSFGETKNGVWIAKEYEGSYGTNGFRLQFNQTGTGTASSSTIGADTSGNTNHWTSSGIVASDCNMPDSPENNFPTMNTNNKDSATVLSEGNLKLSNSTAGTVGARSTMATPTSGKYYVEFAPTISGGNWPRAGIARTSVSGNTPETWFDMQSGASNNRGSGGATTGAFSTGDVGAIAFDADNGKIYLAKNNTWQNSGDPVNGTGYMFDGLTDGPFLFSSYQYHSANVMIWNFGQDSSFAGTETAQGNSDGNGIGDFYYAPPSGFLALCTSNLPEPTISPNADTQADDYFNTVLYSGNGSTDHNITGVGFQPDFVWLKERSSTSFHQLLDVVRGAGVRLESNVTDAETTPSPVGLSSFDADGFTVENNNGYNENSQTYVSWNWKAGGTAVSNTDGSLTSSVSANTDAGFSIVTYTGTGANATVGHGLSPSVPKMIIVKKRSGTSNWRIYFEALGDGTKYLNFTTIASGTQADLWNSTSPTSSVFSIGTHSSTNGNTETFIAYCFAEIEGYSKFGSYTGNGSTDGTFVYTGFRPAFIMTKRTDSTGNWFLYDNKRDINNVSAQVLIPNLSNAEVTGATAGLDILSNGIKIRGNNPAFNASGGTYIYMAFGTAYKYATAR